MQITLDLPEEYAQRLTQQLPDLPHRILEMVVIEAYKTHHLTSAEVGRLLNLNRFAVDAFLKRHQAYLDYAIEDFQQDLQRLQQLPQG